MAGSRKDVRGRWRDAALELYAERGCDRTTTAQLAARAGVTGRTCFQHFPDEREVVVDGEAALLSSLSDAVAVAPVDLPPLEVLRQAFLPKEISKEPADYYVNTHAGLPPTGGFFQGIRGQLG